MPCRAGIGGKHCLYNILQYMEASCQREFAIFGWPGTYSPVAQRLPLRQEIGESGAGEESSYRLQGLPEIKRSHNLGHYRPVAVPPSPQDEICPGMKKPVDSARGADGVNRGWHVPWRTGGPSGPVPQLPGSQPLIPNPQSLIPNQYISSPPPGGPAGAFSSLGFSATNASDVSSRVDTLAAFCSAVRVTFVGSITPAFTRSSYFSVAAL